MIGVLYQLFSHDEMLLGTGRWAKIGSQSGESSQSWRRRRWVLSSWGQFSGFHLPALLLGVGCGVTKASSQTPPPPNPLLELVLTIIVPSVVLDQLSKAERLGPFWALVVSLLFPLGFGVWCFVQKKGWNLFSVLGFVTILLTGGLGLLSLPAFWFAVKESALPIILGAAFPLSHWFGKPLISAMLMQPHIINLPVLQGALHTPERRNGFDAALFRASCGMGLGMLGSSVANFFLAMYLLGGRAPGTEDFVKGIARLNWMSMVVIGVPMMVVMMAVFFRLLKHIQNITGLERDDLLNPGTTVRRQVGS